jgi:hypothetical protein
MKYDVFISYSRKDLNVVEKFVKDLKVRIPNLTYWFDLTGIESGEEFDEKIIKAIDNSSYVLYFLSPNSMKSKWTKEEVMYAKNCGKKVIPVLLNGATLEGWFLFHFGRIDSIDLSKEEQVEKLIKNLSDWSRNDFVELISKCDGATTDSSSIADSVDAVVTEIVEDCTENGHDYVDLGLSVKWATCNVGADSPEDYGDYFAWGETEPKPIYDWSHYKWGNYKWYTGANMEKYTSKDRKIQLDLSDDVACVNWGGRWRIPTHDEFKELREKCNWAWITQNGVKGYKVTSVINGNSIFLPMAGFCEDSGQYKAGQTGYYWSSSLNTDYRYDAICVRFDSRSVDGCYFFRYYGQSIRPVCP